MLLSTEGHDFLEFTIFIHNKGQIYLPKSDEIFGSAFLLLLVDVNKEDRKGMRYHQSYMLRRTHWKAMNTEKKRCDNENTEAETTKCITQYLEHKIGCSFGMSGTDVNTVRYLLNLLKVYILLPYPIDLPLLTDAMTPFNTWSMPNMRSLFLQPMTMRFTK